MPSILQSWVEALGLRHQGVLLTAVRGCDTVERQDVSKWLVRVYRACVLSPHCGDVGKAKSFMLMPATSEEFEQKASEFIQSHDHYPHHYLMHFIHAAEILGYKHPDSLIRDWWSWVYRMMCKKFHMNLETEDELDDRLNADEETFASQQ